MEQHHKKLEYWNDFSCSKRFWPKGVSLLRLEKLLPYILMDKVFWSNALTPYSGEKVTPSEMKHGNLKKYRECLRNFGVLILDAMYKHEVLK